MDTFLPCTSLVERARPRALAVRLLVGLAMLAACSTPAPRATPDAPSADRPAVLTVQELQRLTEQGTPLGVIMGKIDSSGTVYRLDTKQAKDLRASGMPATLMSYIEQTYDRAVQKNPDLAKSDERWTLIDGYWYGGLPFGWPREWVVGAPRLGEAFH